MKKDKGVRPNEQLHHINPTAIKIVSNPRQHSNPGFGPGPMKELRDNVRKDGLKQALEYRMVNGEPVLIAGERRLRSILALLEEGGDCYDRATGEFAPVDEVYATVKCILTECKTDQEAARHAVLENVLHEHLTDYELLLCCERLELNGVSRVDQAAVFSKSEAWVSQSHGLLKGHPKVLEKMHDGLLGRTQALQFMNYPPEKVEGILERAIRYSHMDLLQREEELLKERDKLGEKWEATDAEYQLATSLGDHEQAAELRRTLAETEKEADASERKLKKHRQSTKRQPRPSIANIQNAAKDEHADGGANRHLPMKNVRRMADQLTELLNSGEPLVNTESGDEYNRREVRIVCDVMNCILQRNAFKTPLDALSTTEGDEPPELAAAAK